MYEYKGKVLRVVDADTVDVLVDVGFAVFLKKRVRLAGVDAWETRGPEREDGLKAKKRVEELLPLGCTVVLTTKKVRGKYGRYVAWITTPTGESLSDLLVKEGHARRVNW